VAQTIASGASSTTALSGSTEEEQFAEPKPAPEAPRAGAQTGYQMKGRE
jgi:hypothetical protein